MYDLRVLSLMLALPRVLFMSSNLSVFRSVLTLAADGSLSSSSDKIGSSSSESGASASWSFGSSISSGS